MKTCLWYWMCIQYKMHLKDRVNPICMCIYMRFYYLLHRCIIISYQIILLNIIWIIWEIIQYTLFQVHVHAIHWLVSSTLELSKARWIQFHKLRLNGFLIACTFQRWLNILASIFTMDGGQILEFLNNCFLFP